MNHVTCDFETGFFAHLTVIPNLYRWFLLLVAGTYHVVNAVGFKHSHVEGHLGGFQFGVKVAVNSHVQVSV